MRHLGLSILTIFTTGFIGLQNAVTTLSKTVVLMNQEIGCIPNTTEDFSMSITWKASRKGFHDFFIVFSNTLVKSTDSYHNDQTYPTSYVSRNTAWNHSIMFAGTTKTITFTIPRKMITSTANMFYLYDREYSSDWSKSSLYMNSFRLDVQYPTEFDLSQEGDIYRVSSGFTGASIVDGTIYQNPYRIAKSGFEKEIFNPDKNRIPLKGMQLTVSNYKKEQIEPNYKKAYLKIKNYLSDFTIFSKVSDGKTTWREVPLTLWPNDNGDGYVFYTNDVYAVSMDGRYQKLADDKGKDDLLTRDIYLPPVDAGKVRVFQFEIVIEKTGPNSLDTLRHVFEVTKSENYIGSCVSSSYCVGME